MNTLHPPIVRWYVVANRTDAVVFRDAESKFHALERLLNADGNKKERDLDSDRAGRGAGGPGTHGIHDLGSRHAKRDETARRFSGRIVKMLEQARSQGKFDELVLVAEPHFLGLMKQSFSNPLRKRVIHQITQEYQEADPHLRAKVLRALEAKN